MESCSPQLPVINKSKRMVGIISLVTSAT